MTWRDFWFLMVGLFVGTNVGLFLLALCFAARRGDDMAQSSKLKAERRKKNRSYYAYSVISKRTFSLRPPKKRPVGPPPPGPMPKPDRGIRPS